MHTIGSRHYLGVGLSAMRSIDRALRHTQIKPRNILDLPSGHGRVLRFLRVAFGEADITSCELDRGAVEFCERTFGVTGILSNTDVSALTFPRQFDLIWCGSLVTHLDEQRTADLLRSFWRHLTPGGLCLFTTHGQTALNWLLSGTETYGLSAAVIQKVLSEFAARGFGYTDYDQPGYGFSLVSLDRMTKISSAVGDWSLAVFLEAGWDDHQDVYGFTKPGPGSRAASSPLIVNAASGKSSMQKSVF
jgi:SAM-dependent methyltransferase